MDINVVWEGNLSVNDFDNVFNNESFVVSKSESLQELMVELGLFKSRSAARAAGRVGPIPDGYTEFKGNKKTFLYLWNPTDNGCT